MVVKKNHIHAHAHEKKQVNVKNLIFTLVLNLIIVLAEIIGGLISGSLSLISDALHNLSDFAAIFITYVAYLLSMKKFTEKRTFGYKRAQVLAGLFNAFALAGIIFFLFYEAVNRMIKPVRIDASLVVIVGSIGFLANFLSVILLKKDSKENLNFRSAYLHLLGDTLSSVVVVIGAVFIYFFNWYIIDPILTILIGLYILKESINLVLEIVSILMHNTPKNIDLKRINEELLKIDLIKNIHHVHIWQLDDKNIYFEAHVDVSNMTVKETEEIHDRIEKTLHNMYSINHCTLQFECCRHKNTDFINSDCTER